MRICLVSREYPPYSQASGVGTYTHSMARALSEIGHSVFVVTLSANRAREYHSGNIHTFEIVPRSYRLVWRLSRWIPVWKLEYSASVNAALRELHSRYRFDIVEFPEWGGEGFFFSRRPVCPFVVKIHGPTFLNHQFDRSPSSRLLRRIEDWMERSVVLRANATTVASRSMMAMASRQWQLPPERITLIPLPLEVDAFVPAPGSVPQNDRRVAILYVGRIEYRKGVHILAQAIPDVLKRYPDARFTFIGKDTLTTRSGSSVRDELQRFLREQHAAHAVTFLDQMDRARLTAFYQGSDLCVMPSLFEPMGFTGLEAMASAKPAIVSSNAGLAEWIEDGQSGLLARPGRADELAEKIVTFLGLSMNERERMGNAARRVAEQFSPSSTARLAADHYASVIHGPHRHASLEAHTDTDTNRSREGFIRREISHGKPSHPDCTLE